MEFVWDRVDRVSRPEELVAVQQGLESWALVRAYRAMMRGLTGTAGVLDLGAGPGGETTYVGVDNSLAMARRATSRGRRMVVGDAAALPFADRAFTAVRADRVLQHVPDPVRVLAEAVRVTRPASARQPGDLRPTGRETGARHRAVRASSGLDHDVPAPGDRRPGTDGRAGHYPAGRAESGHHPVSRESGGPDAAALVQAGVPPAVRGSGDPDAAALAQAGVAPAVREPGGPDAAGLVQAGVAPAVREPGGPDAAGLVQAGVAPAVRESGGHGPAGLVQAGVAPAVRESGGHGSAGDEAGGWVVAADPDQSTLTIDAGGCPLAAAVARFRRGHVRNGDFAGKAAAAFGAAGLVDVRTRRWRLVITEPERAFGITTWGELMVEEGLFDERERRRWEAALATGPFRYELDYVVTAGRRMV